MDFMSTTEAAQILGITPESVTRLVRKEKLTGQKFGNSWMVERGSVMAYAETIKGKTPHDPTRGKQE